MKKLKRSLAGLLVAALIFTMLPVTAYAAGIRNYGTIVPTGWGTVNFSSSWAADVYSFTPTTTGWYTFYSYNNNFDMYGYLTSPGNYSTVYNSLANSGCQNDTARAYSYTYDDDSGGERNFSMKYLCYAGQTYYYFITKYSSSGSGTSKFTVSNVDYGYVTLNRNGGSGGTGGFYTSYYSNAAWLSSSSSSTTNYISPPTRTGYTFSGYYDTAAASGGTQYVSANGTLVNNVGTLSTTLYARWQQNVYILTFNNQGVANTSQTIAYGSSLPANATVPSRIGYQFNGYYNAASGGTQYYNSSGARVNNFTVTSAYTLYAQWSPKTYSITYNGLADATIGTKPSTHTYNTSTVIPAPTKAEYTFMGWSVNGGTVLSKNLTLSPTGYMGNITLTANWVKKSDATVENPDSILTSDEISKEDLQKIFNNPVPDATKGVTTAELNNSSAIHLKLSVQNISGTPDGEDEIKQVTNGEVIKFFDVTVIKEITAEGGDVTSTRLSEVPDTIQIRIPLVGDMANKSSYQVLRYHTYTENKDGGTNTVSETHQLDNDTGKGEYFTVEGNDLVIHTRMFSTYAIAAGETSLTGNGTLGNGTNTDGSEFDVQARISQSDITAVYKIDVSWGPMVFEYTTSRQWDPDNHIYLGASYDWAPASFEGGNNRVALANHSNADVNVDFAFVAETDQLQGVDVTFKEVNADTAPAVSHYFLSKVPAEGADAPTLESYLWLKGTPAKLPGEIPPSGGETPVAKVGVINVTVAAEQNPVLTPKN